MPLPRLIPCLDVAGGRVVKGIKFEGLRDVGDPVELGAAYSDAGADELVFLDIKATVDNRDSLVELVERVAERLAIPFTGGGGVRDCLCVGASVDQQFDHLEVFPYPVAVDGMMQRGHARLVLQVHVAALVKELFDCLYVSAVYVIEQFRFLSAKVNGI